MYSHFRSRFGIPGVIAVIALVFAMAGGAIAAKKYVITSTKQIKPSVLKQLKGAQGTAGTNGTNGTNGANGAPGKEGPEGKQGQPGAAGKNVEVGTATGCGGPGGAFVQVEGEAGTKKEICNGEDGLSGFTETLPPGDTETGVWTFGDTDGKAASSILAVPLSFSIPLTEPLTGENVHFIQTNGKEIDLETFEEVDPTECEGSAAAPVADPGNLCIFAASLNGAKSFGSLVQKLDGTPGADSVGAQLKFILTAEEGANGAGSFAVTAAEP